MPARKLTDAQYEAIKSDPRSAETLAAVYGISKAYVHGIRDGSCTCKFSKPAAAKPAAAKPARDARFYRPFRDGTYS